MLTFCLKEYEKLRLFFRLFLSRAKGELQNKFSYIINYANKGDTEA